MAILMVSMYNLNAQLTVNPQVVEISDMDFTAFDVIANSRVTNTSQNTQGIIWTREEISMPAEWASAICDTTTCYLPHVSTQSFQLPAGASGKLDVHVYPYNVEGSAVIAVHLALATDPEEIIVTSTYLFNTSLGVAEKLTEKAKVFPNPATDQFWIESEFGAQQAVLHDMNGRVVLQQTMHGKQAINVSSLARGHYILRLYDASGAVVSTNAVSKQ